MVVPAYNHRTLKTGRAEVQGYPLFYGLCLKNEALSKRKREVERDRGNQSIKTDFSFAL